MEELTTDFYRNISCTTFQDDPEKEEKAQSNGDFSSNVSIMAVGYYLAVIVIFGTVGNSVVIHVIYKEVKFHTATYMLIFNLAISDFAVCCFGTPLSCSSSFVGYWLYGKIGCEYYGFLNYYCGCISLNSYAAIALVRFNIIVRRRSVTKLQILRLICVIHAYTCVFTIPPLLGWNAFVLEGFYTQCDIAYKVKTPLYLSYICVMFVWLFFAPLIIIMFCYFRIIRYVGEHKARFERTHRLLTTGRRRKGNSVSINSFRTSMIILICCSVFLFTWLPYCILVSYGLLGNPDHISQTASAVPALIAKTSTIFNPFILIGFNREFYDTLLHRQCACGPQSNSKMTSRDKNYSLSYGGITVGDDLNKDSLNTRV